MEAVPDFIFLGYKITEEGDCSHEIKRCLLLGRKGMTNLDSVLKSRDITLTIKVHIAKAMIFPVVMYGRGSWTTEGNIFPSVSLGGYYLDRKIFQELDRLQN